MFVLFLCIASTYTSVVSIEQWLMTDPRGFQVAEETKDFYE